MSTAAFIFPVIQRYLTRYGITTYLTMGNIGLIFNIIIFSQLANRRNSCSLYILIMSCCSLIGLNSAVIPIIYSLDHPNPLSTSLALCRIQYYLRHVFSQSMRTFFILACADRYASCNRRVYIRSFSRYIVAIRIVPLVLLIWLLLGILPTMCYSVTNGICDAPSGLSDIIYTSYIMLVLGVLPLIALFTFGILILINLKSTRSRARSIQHGNPVAILRKRDRDMMKMLLIELSIYIITTIPNTIVNVYRVSVPKAVTGSDRQYIESFVYYFARVFLLYLNNALSFWVYLSTSRSFRSEIKSLLLKIFPCLEPKNTQVITPN